MKHKIVNKNSNFTIVPNDLIRNPNITAIAKAVFCYLSSRPDNWEFYAVEITKNFKEGRDAVKNAIDCLVAHAYLSRTQVRKSGKFSHNVYEIHYSPFTEIPLTAKPSTAKPLTANPLLTNTDLKKTELTKTKKTIKTNKKELMLNSFQEFWEFYGIKKDRVNAEKAYAAALKSGVTHETIMGGVQRYQAECIERETERKFIKRPASFLNGKNWNDEHEKVLTREEREADIQRIINQPKGDRLCLEQLTLKRAD